MSRSGIKLRMRFESVPARGKLYLLKRMLSWFNISSHLGFHIGNERTRETCQLSVSIKRKQRRDKRFGPRHSGITQTKLLTLLDVVA